MYDLQKYNKAIVAVLGAAITLLGLFGVEVPVVFQDPETIAKVAALLTPLLVYIIPNKPSTSALTNQGRADPEAAMAIKTAAARIPIPVVLAFGLALALGACGLGRGASPEPLSPREQAEQVADVYASLLSGVNTALKLVTVDKATKQKIQAVSTTATNAFLEYYDEAGNCIRDPETRQIVSVPGAVCDQSLIGRLYGPVRSIFTDLHDLLARFNVQTEKISWTSSRLSSFLPAPAWS